MRAPSVGRIVHYQSYGTPSGKPYASLPRAAIVSAVPEDWSPENPIDLVVFNPTGLHFNRAEYNEDGKPGTWRWPLVTP